MVLVILIGVVSALSALMGGWLRIRQQECDRLVRLIAPDLGVTGQDVRLSEDWQTRAGAIGCLPPMMTAIVLVGTAGVLPSLLFLAAAGMAVGVGAIVGATSGSRSLRAVALDVRRTVCAVRKRDTRSDLDLLAARLDELVTGVGPDPATVLFGEHLPDEVADLVTDSLAASEPPTNLSGEGAAEYDEEPLVLFCQSAARPLWRSALEDSRISELEMARAALRGVDWTVPADRERMHALVSRLRQWPPRELRGLAPAVGPVTPRG